MANALNKVNSGGIEDGSIVNADIKSDAAIAKSKLAALDLVNADINASAAIAGSKLADEGITLAKLEHGDGSSNGKFLRSNNGADPTWETVSVPTLSDPIVTGDTDIADGGTVTHTITNWSDDITYVFAPTNCTIGTVNTSGQFVVTETADHPSYTIKATTTSIGLGDSSVINKTLKTRLSAPTLSSPADSPTATNVAYTITSTNANDNKLVLNIGSANFTYQSVSVGSASKVGNTVECTGFTTNNPVVTVQYTVVGTYSVTAVAKDTTNTWADSVASAADSITIANSYNVDFLIIGGGGGANGFAAGGAGAGGYKNSYGSESSGANSTTLADIDLSPGTDYTITIGDGGASAADGQISGGTAGTDTILKITGGADVVTAVGGASSDGDGGCGGGKSRYSGSGGSGTANQGMDGGGHNGGSAQDKTGGGGGGAGTAGSPASAQNNSGDGGEGLASSITGSAVSRAGGGGGGTRGEGASPGGTGGGGASQNTGDGIAGTANTGSGGGAGCLQGGTYHGGGNGGKGVLILRCPTADNDGSSITGSGNAATTDGSDTIMTFIASGTLQG